MHTYEWAADTGKWMKMTKEVKELTECLRDSKIGFEVHGE